MAAQKIPDPAKSAFLDLFAFAFFVSFFAPVTYQR